MNSDGFGVRLRARRYGAALTQEELAERSGLSVRAIRDLERGRVARPRRETVRLLATALGLGQDDHDELLRLARRAIPPTPNGPDGTELPADAPAAPAGGGDPRPTAVPLAGPARSPRAAAGGIRVGHLRGRRLAARFALVLVALLIVTVPSSDRDPLDPASPRHVAHASVITSRAVSAIEVAGDDAPLGDPSSVGADLRVLHPVARGDALIVTVALTGAGAGPITVTDTAANRYRAAGDIESGGRHRLLLFALLDAKPLDTLDVITVLWPRATIDHVSVDAFHGVTAAGPSGGGASDAGTSSDSQPFTVDDLLPLCPAGDLLFTAVSTPDSTDAELDPPWHTVNGPHQPTRPLTTAYRTITSDDDRCEVTGFAPQPFQTIAVRLH